MTSVLARRFLVVAALMFWQGGFTFYASVVVPVGRSVLGMEQGFITQRVTDFLNVSGAVALVLLAWDPAVSQGGARWVRQIRWLAWIVMAATLALLVAMHLRLDRLLDREALQVLSPREFRAPHRAYLWISTVQWAAAVVYVLFTLVAWRAEDRLSCQQQSVTTPNASGDS